MGGLRNTGDLQGKLSDAVIDIYKRLSKANSLVPQSIAIIMDSEDYSEGKKKELTHRSGGLIKFLPRRMFENYLLHPEALAEVMNSIANFRTPGVTPLEVSKKIEELRNDESYFKPLPIRHDVSWIQTIHGKEVLKKLFNHFSETRCPYHEIDQEIAETEVLVDRYPVALQDLALFLKGLLVRIPNSSPSDGSPTQLLIETAGGARLSLKPPGTLSSTGASL